MATKRRKTKSRRKSRRRKSRKSCKHGKLKRPVKTKSGRKRRCKKKSKKKSKQRSKKRRKNKSRRRKRSYRFENCGVPTDLGTCLGGEDAISMEEIDTENGNVNDYIQFGDDDRCTTRDNWNQWLRRFRQHETMATNPFTRTKTWCGDTYPRNHNDEPKQNDSWLSEQQIDLYVGRRDTLAAADRNDMEPVIRYLDNRGDIYIQDPNNGESLLMKVAKHNNLILVDRILREDDIGMAPFTLNDNGDTILHIAVREQNEALVEILLRYRRDDQLDFRDGNRNTALDIAEILNMPGMIELLGSDETQTQIFLRSASNDNKIEIIREMLESGINVDVQDERTGNTALMNACFEGNINIVKLLIRNGANVNHKNAGFNTPLIQAIATHYNPRELQRRKFEVVKELLAAGADPNATDSYNTTPLMFAAEYGLTDVVKELLYEGANKHLENHVGETALDFAIVGNNYRTENLGQVENREIIILLQPTSPPPTPESPGSRDRRMRDQFQAMEDAGVIRSPPREMLDRMITSARDRRRMREAGEQHRAQFQAMEDAGLINYAPRSPAPSPESPAPAPRSPTPAPAPNCRQFRKTVNPKCNDQPNCNWEVGVGCRRKRAAAPAPAPDPAPAVWTSAAAAVATNCSQFRKTTNPKCNDQANCNWVVGSGCRRRRAAAAPAPAAPVTNCSQFRKTMNPKCNDQSDCKWVVGSGCKNK